MDFKKNGYWIVLIVVFILGILASPKKCPEPIECPVIETSLATCQTNREELWKQLKATDDRGFAIAGRGFEIVSEAFTAAANFDLDALDKCSNDLAENLEPLEVVTQQRLQILQELGY